MASSPVTAGSSVAPMRQKQNMEFPYKHSTGETVGRFLAGLKEQKKIWGQRAAGQGVVVPPLGYSEIDGSDAGEWVEVANTGVITAAARVDHPIERLHPSAKPFAFVLVKLDGADTGLAHIVTEELDRVAVGARVEAVFAADEARIGSIRDIAGFRVIADAPPTKVKAAAPAKAKPAPAKAVPAGTKRTAATKATQKVRAKSAKAKPAQAKPAKTKLVKAKPAKGKAQKVKTNRPVAKKPSRKVTRAKTTKPARAKKPRVPKKPARKPAKAKTTKRTRRR